jgi:hypothetical protein
MTFLVATFLSIASLFLWGGICFLYFRFRYGGSEEQKRAFLQTYSRVLTFRYDGTKQDATSAIIKKAGNRGWSSLALPIPLMGFEFTFWNILLSIGVLFFGGLLFSYSWFGLRCLESLGLKSYPGNGGLIGSP